MLLHPGPDLVQRLRDPQVEDVQRGADALRREHGRRLQDELRPQRDRGRRADGAVDVHSGFPQGVDGLAALRRDLAQPAEAEDVGDPEADDALQVDAELLRDTIVDAADLDLVHGQFGLRSAASVDLARLLLAEHGEDVGASEEPAQREVLSADGSQPAALAVGAAREGDVPDREEARERTRHPDVDGARLVPVLAHELRHGAVVAAWQEVRRLDRCAGASLVAVAEREPKLRLALLAEGPSRAARGALEGTAVTGVDLVHADLISE